MLFDDQNLVSCAGWYRRSLVIAAVSAAGLHRLADAHPSVATDKGANAGSNDQNLWMCSGEGEPSQGMI
ncbi:MAG TPA: hypothetical protein VFJ50_03420 [Gemmatimonadales bacterium]|nr:hypothetical protein [Gemmatimonadales bacterium]